MRLLFASTRLHVPDDFSGSVQSTHAMIQGLVARGHEVEIVASLPRAWRHFAATAVYRLSRRRIVHEWSDRRNGYPTHRGVEWRFTERLAHHVDRFRPEAIILDAVPQARALARAGYVPPVPVVVMIHDPSFADDPSPLGLPGIVRFVANSPHTRAEAAKVLGIDAAIVPPVVYLPQYRTDRPSARFITLVTPDPRKGLDIVLAMAARMSTVSFLLVEGWPMDRAAWRSLRSRVRELPNITLRRMTADMRTVYRDTRVLLVPSQLAETFGRVVIEAQTSGIPVMVTTLGALPWVTGAGGIVLPPDTAPEQWVEKLSHLLSNDTAYHDLSRAALENVRRSDFQPNEVIGRFEQILRDLLSFRDVPQ